MEEHNPLFNIYLMYAEEIVDCKATMQENSYDVNFDGRWMASVEHTEDWTWIQASGVILPQEVIDEIGFNIESEYK